MQRDIKAPSIPGFWFLYCLWGKAGSSPLKQFGMTGACNDDLERKRPGSRRAFGKNYRLDVVVQSKLIRMGAQTNRVHFLGALVVDVGAEQFLGEDVAFKQEGMIFFEGVQCVFK